MGHSRKCRSPSRKSSCCKQKHKKHKKPRDPPAPVAAPLSYSLTFGAFEDFEAGQKWFLLPGGNSLESTASQVFGAGTPTYDYEAVALGATTKIDFSVLLITSFPPVQGGQPETAVVVDVDFYRNEVLVLTVPGLASPSAARSGVSLALSAGDRVAVRVGYSASNVNFPDITTVVDARFY
jgi:hypothetical protein